MGDLLNEAVEAHGGLDRWRRYKDLAATISVTGGLWAHKRRRDGFDAVTLPISAATQEPCLILHAFPTSNRIGFFEPRCVTIETSDERIVVRRQNPRASFLAHTLDTPWDPCHAVYFLGATLWTALTVPFLYTYPGFESEEISPCEKNGERWRRLAVRCPADMPGHAHRQIACFGPDGLLRRYDNAADLLGTTPVVDHASNYEAIGGITLAKTRRIFEAGVDDPLMDMPVLAIDITAPGLR